MTDKRFRVHDLVKFNYSEIGEYTDENHTDKPLRNDEIVNLLNTLYEENEQVKQLIHTILVQLDIEKIATPDTVYSAKIVFTTEEFKLINKMWKGK